MGLAQGFLLAAAAPSQPEAVGARVARGGLPSTAGIERAGRRSVAPWSEAVDQGSLPSAGVSGGRVAWAGAVLTACSASRRRLLSRRRRRSSRLPRGATYDAGDPEESTALSRSGGGSTDLATPSPEEENLELLFQERAAGALMDLDDGHEAAILRWNDKSWEYFDVALVNVSGGDGGRGAKSWYRAPKEPYGGPAGGNGGHGGHVFLRASPAVDNLMDLKSKVHYKAERGGPGKKREKHGENGKSRYIDVPIGTCVYIKDQWLKGSSRQGRRIQGETNGMRQLLTQEDIRTRHFAGELTKPGQVLRVARGGRGGRGNAAFKNARDNAPWMQEIGERGFARWIECEVKTVADIGLIGAPNAGKTSLLCATTRKLAKIAAYPFTTVAPNVGTYRHDQSGYLTLCDVPGLVEGAHEGRGMGIQFLRHVERCRTLMHVVSLDSEDPIRDFDEVQESLRKYSTEVATKPQVVVVNKCDITEKLDMLPDLMAALRKRCGHSRVFDVSAATQYHLKDLMKRVFQWNKSLVRKEVESVDTSRAEGGLFLHPTRCRSSTRKVNLHTSQLKKPPVLHDLKPGEAEMELEEARLLVGQRQTLRINAGIDGVSKKQQIEDLDPVRKKNKMQKGKMLSGEYDGPLVEYDVLYASWRLLHPELERIAQMDLFKWQDGLDRFNWVVQATGTQDALAEVGAMEGDSIYCGDLTWNYTPGNIFASSRMLAFEHVGEKVDPEYAEDFRTQRPNRRN